MSGCFGIFLAWNGYGVWTLIWQQISKALINTLLLWWYSSWYPKLYYSWRSFKELFAFGSNLLLSGLLDTVYNNIYQIVIGKMYNATNLGYYTQANQISSLPSSNIHGMIGNVTYPVLSKIQDDDVRLADNYRKILRFSAFIIFPLMCGLASVSYPLINLLLGEKWNECAMLLIPISFSMMWYPVHAINLNLLKVKGRSDLFLKLEVIKKVLGVLVLLITLPFGLLTMCYGTIVSSLFALVINTYYTGILIRVDFFTQMKDLSGTILISLTMFVIVFSITQIVDGYFSQLIIGLTIGSSYYLITSFLFKVEELNYIKLLLQR